MSGSGIDVQEALSVALPTLTRLEQRLYGRIIARNFRNRTRYRKTIAQDGPVSAAHAVVATVALAPTYVLIWPAVFLFAFSAGATSPGRIASYGCLGIMLLFLVISGARFTTALRARRAYRQ